MTRTMKVKVMELVRDIVAEPSRKIKSHHKKNKNYRRDKFIANTQNSLIN